MHVQGEQCIGTCINARASADMKFRFCSYLNKEIASIRKHGAWEPIITKLLVKALAAAPGAQVIDVGARTGWFTTVAALAGHHVIAIEPNRRSNCFIDRNAAVNNVTDRVLLLSHGADKVERVLTLTGMRVKVANESADVASAGDRVFTPTPQQISTVRLDSLLPLLFSRTILVEMDVEGFECEALIGGAHLLRTRQVAMLMHEWSGGSDAAERGCDWFEAVQPLREQGLDSFHLHGTPLDFRPGTLVPTITVVWKAGSR